MLPKLVHGFFCEWARGEQDGKTTAIGIWGYMCRVFGTAPAALQNMSFHLHVHNPDGKPHPVKIAFHLPGVVAPLEVEATLRDNESGEGHNINVNLCPIVLHGPGEIVAHVLIESDPPVSGVYSMKIEFVESQ